MSILLIKWGKKSRIFLKTEGMHVSFKPSGIGSFWRSLPDRVQGTREFFARKLRNFFAVNLLHGYNSPWIHGGTLKNFGESTTARGSFASVARANLSSDQPWDPSSGQ